MLIYAKNSTPNFTNKIMPMSTTISPNLELLSRLCCTMSNDFTTSFNNVFSNFQSFLTFFLYQKTQIFHYFTITLLSMQLRMFDFKVKRPRNYMTLFWNFWKREFSLYSKINNLFEFTYYLLRLQFIFDDLESLW